MNKTLLQLLINEWNSGILLNPFGLINNVDAEHSKKKVLEACALIAEHFLKCTSYRVIEYESVRESEKAFVTAMLFYLYDIAPPDEQNIAMLCQLVKAEIEAHYSDTTQTDLDRLISMLAEKNKNHDAIKYFNIYLASSAGRAAVVKSLIKRFCPLISFHGEDANIFEYCSEREIFEMGVSLLHNLGSIYEMPLGLKHHAREIAFISAALHLMYSAYPTKEQTAGAFYNLINNPALLDRQIRENSNSVDEAKKYWKICSEFILAGKFDKPRVTGIENFFKEFM